MHRFGGRGWHRGITPTGTRTPLHLLLLLDLRDPNCPVKSDRPLRRLPLYYPLKYGYGGPSVQYDVRSDSTIKLLFISDPKPDATDRQYVQVDQFPQSRAEIVPLTYAEARIIGFRKASGFFQPNRADMAVLNRLDREHEMVELGGDWPLHPNAGDVICRNPACDGFNRRVSFQTIARIPPVAVTDTTTSGTNARAVICGSTSGFAAPVGR